MAFSLRVASLAARCCSHFRSSLSSTISPLMNQLESSGNRTAYRPVGLSRYGSAPGSLLSSIADSIINGHEGDISVSGLGKGLTGVFFSGDSPSLMSESSFLHRSNASSDLDRSFSRIEGCERSCMPTEYGRCEEMAPGSHLIRQSSSPAGFFANSLVDSNLFPKRNRTFSQINSNDTHTKKQRLSSEWSFFPHDNLSQISEISIADMGKKVSRGNSPTEVSRNLVYPYVSGNIPFSSWDDSNSIVAPPPSKKLKDSNGDIMANFNKLESQLSLPCTSLEMEAVEKYLMQQDSIHCKLRAKRGCATHPRSIAERERRIRISKRLRRLQDLMPNMDNQTSTSDMLDLALHYIKELQSQIQKLNQGRAECSCSCSVKLKEC